MVQPATTYKHVLSYDETLVKFLGGFIRKGIMKQIQKLLLGVMLCAVATGMSLQGQGEAAQLNAPVESAHFASVRSDHRHFSPQGDVTREDRAFMCDALRDIMPEVNPTVWDDLYAYMLRDDISADDLAKAIDIYERSVELADQKEALLSVTAIDAETNEVRPALDPNHDALQVFDRKFAELEKEARALIYASKPANEATFMSAGIAALAAMFMYRSAKVKALGQEKEYDGYLDKFGRGLHDRLPDSRLHGLYGVGDNFKPCKNGTRPKTTAALTFVSVFLVTEYILRGRYSVGAGNLGSGAKSVGNFFSDMGAKLFGENGLLDNAEKSAEDFFREASKNLDGLSKAELGVGAAALAGAAYYLYKRPKAPATATP